MKFDRTKPIFKATAAAAALAFIAAPMASAAVPGPWTGPFAGARAGLNHVKSDHSSSENALNLGVYGGYQMQFTRHFTFGGDVFYNGNQKKDHAIYNDAGASVGTGNFGTTTYGLDLLAGFPVGTMNAWMPFVKVGYGWGKLHGNDGATSGSEHAPRYGLGVAWKLSRSLSLNAQFMHQNFGSSNDNLENNDWTVGATWHFSPSY